ncbi:MAG TPA: NlpC/P60 family protein [Nocardioidaceae bacterium]|nr:NlpC/P60 family protein [Nocardioidaceae bacterium]
MTDTAIAVPVTTVWTSPDAPRENDAPAVGDSPDVAAWIASMDAANRLELHGRTLTQALLGEPVVVTEERAGWVHVTLPWQPSERDPAGYPGWIPAAHVGAAPAADGGPVVVVTPTTAVRTDDGPLQLSYGTILQTVDVDAVETTVVLPGDRIGRLPSDEVRPPGLDPKADSWADSLLDASRQFVGLSYLWGGTCGWGLDCSGFVHLVHRAHGVQVPRDALDQLPAARPIALDTAVPGDLLFFARPGERPYHVGFVAPSETPGRHTMVHAPEETDLIEELPLAPSRIKDLVRAGTFRPEATT